MQDNNWKVPEISIDQALNLFLAVTYPNGVPEGVDKEQLLEILRQKIAQDRPEWAGADAQASASSAADSEAKNYSRVKEEIACRAQQEEVPQDPEERYFYERRKQARQNRLQKEENDRERQIREDLRKRLVNQNKEAAEETLEKTVRIRQALEQRLKKALQVQGESNKPLVMQPPAAGVLQPLQNSEPAPGHIEKPHIGRPRISTFDRNFWESLKTMEPKEQAESLRCFNRARREKLKAREEVLRVIKSFSGGPGPRGAGSLCRPYGPSREPLDCDSQLPVPGIHHSSFINMIDSTPDRMEFSREKQKKNQLMKLEL